MFISFGPILFIYCEHVSVSADNLSSSFYAGCASSSFPSCPVFLRALSFSLSNFSLSSVSVNVGERAYMVIDLSADTPHMLTGKEREEKKEIQPVPHHYSRIATHLLVTCLYLIIDSIAISMNISRLSSQPTTFLLSGRISSLAALLSRRGHGRSIASSSTSRCVALNGAMSLALTLPCRTTAPATTCVDTSNLRVSIWATTCSCACVLRNSISATTPAGTGTSATSAVDVSSFAIISACISSNVIVSKVRRRSPRPARASAISI